jgi:hypothetical protein
MIALPALEKRKKDLGLRVWAWTLSPKVRSLGSGLQPDHSHGR